MRRLQDKTQFEYQTAQSMFSDELQTLGQKMDWETVMTASQDQWNKTLAGIQVQDWINMETYKAKSASAAAAATGISEAAVGGAKYLPDLMGGSGSTDSTSTDFLDMNGGGPTGTPVSSGNPSLDYLNGQTSTADYLGGAASQAEPVVETAAET